MNFVYGRMRIITKTILIRDFSVAVMYDQFAVLFFAISCAYVTASVFLGKTLVARLAFSRLTCHFPLWGVTC